MYKKDNENNHVYKASILKRSIFHYITNYNIKSIWVTVSSIVASAAKKNSPSKKLASANIYCGSSLLWIKDFQNSGDICSEVVFGRTFGLLQWQCVGTARPVTLLVYVYHNTFTAPIHTWHHIYYVPMACIDVIIRCPRGSRGNPTDEILRLLQTICKS